MGGVGEGFGLFVAVGGGDGATLLLHLWVGWVRVLCGAVLLLHGRVCAVDLGCSSSAAAGCEGSTAARCEGSEEGGGGW